MKHPGLKYRALSPVKRFVIGDIHGAHRALVQCLERSKFNKQTDLLICLGDLGDGWPDVDKVFDELLGIKNLVLLLGNHDVWLLKWFETGEAPDTWLVQGGDITIHAYENEVPDAHITLLRNARLYYILENNLFVHGGFLPNIPIEQQDKEVFLWDRSLVKAAMFHKQFGKKIKLTRFDRVYVGHTPTINFNEIKPIITGGVCMMDTGAGWPGGILTMMNIDSKEISQSDNMSELYKGSGGRQ
jgi:serine/threonine protein phosphatase 1